MAGGIGRGGFHCGALSRPRLNEHSEYIQSIVKNGKVNILPRLHRQFFIFMVKLQLRLGEVVEIMAKDLFFAYAPTKHVSVGNIGSF